MPVSGQRPISVPEPSHAFIGSNSALVAPVSIGDGAIIGAGSTITGTVEADALVIERAQRLDKPGWARVFREKMKALLGK
jgi:bifunctional UDP-N-acetylglucosamine pyrophosphorylase/glucosamine-1-phosphate N-acetyltransferase